jgi:hypothetical protein
MSAPTLDRPPGNSQSTSSGARRRRRPLLLVVATSLVVVAAAVGTSLALANRSPRPPATAVATPGAVTPNQPAGQVADQDTDANQPTASDRNTGAGTGVEQAPVLPDGTHHAYINKVDAGKDRIVVDVVQRFVDDEAVEAAIADGKSREEARFLTTWIRNQNPRLRTLPLAADLRVDLFQGCEEPTTRKALLDKLAANARSGAYYYTLTVSGGAVSRIQERVAGNAC